MANDFDRGVYSFRCRKRRRWPAVIKTLKEPGVAFTEIDLHYSSGNANKVRFLKQRTHGPVLSGCERGTSALDIATAIWLRRGSVRRGRRIAISQYSLTKKRAGPAAIGA